MPSQAIPDFLNNYNSIEHFIFANGPDPSKITDTYKVLAREYENALILVKLRPTSTSLIGPVSQTMHELNGTYHYLYPNGTLGSSIKTILLGNNEAAILIKDDAAYYQKLYNITLEKGLNLFSIPYALNDYNIKSIFATHLSDLDSIYYYDPIEKWKVYHTNSSIPSTLMNLEPKTAYFVIMKDNINLTIKGNLTYYNGTMPTKLLKPGWNLIGIINSTSQHINSTLTQQNINYTTVWTFNNTIINYSLIDPDNFFEVSKGYWVFVESSEQPQQFAPTKKISIFDVIKDYLKNLIKSNK